MHFEIERSGREWSRSIILEEESMYEHILFVRWNQRSKILQSKKTFYMELKYETDFQRNIFESSFISNLNQVILDDITWDMAIFVGHAQTFSKYLISSDIQYIWYPYLTRPRPVLEVRHGS